MKRLFRLAGAVAGNSPLPAMIVWLQALIGLLVSAPVCALTVDDASGGQVALGRSLAFMEDPHDRLDFDQVRLARTRGGFAELADGDEPNFGYVGGTIWLHVPLHNRSAREEWLLELPFPTLDEVEVLLVEKAGGQPTAHFLTGDHHSFSSRPLPHRYFLFPLTLETGGTYDLYLRVRSEGSMTLPLFLWDPVQFGPASRTGYMAMTFYLGILAALFAYNLLLYFPLRDRVYLYYAAFVVSMALGMGSWHGLLFEYFWPDLPQWGNLAALVGFNLTGMFGAIFSRTFLSSGEYAPKLDRLMLYCAWAFGALAASAPLLPYQAVSIVTSVTGVVFSLVTMVSSVVCLRRGQRSARYFLLAWTILLLGTAALGARNLDILATNFFSRYSMQLGSALEALLLSFALAERITDLRRRKEAAENRALHDPLTGLGNRAMLELSVGQALEEAAPAGHKVALLAIDLDGFKPINDQHGHHTGDLLLTRIAERLRQMVAGGATVVRLGGDEFVIVLPGLSEREDATRVAADVVAQVAWPIRIDNQEFRISASVGVAAYPEDGDDGATLLKCADRAMYEAKRSGRNCFSSMGVQALG